MGCDIHAYTEKFDPATGLWETLDHYSEPEDGEEIGEVTEVLQLNRNYALFGIMACVRFEDLPTISHVELGIPDDACPEYKAIAAREGDEHSHNYLTFREILDYDWDQTVKLGGAVEGYGLLEFLIKGEPTSYMDARYVPQKERVQAQELWKQVAAEMGLPLDITGREDLLANRILRQRVSSFIGDQTVMAEWDQTVSDLTGRQLLEGVKLILNENPGVEPEHIRTTFFFDN